MSRGDKEEYDEIKTELARVEKVYKEKKAEVKRQEKLLNQSDKTLKRQKEKSQEGKPPTLAETINTLDTTYRKYFYILWKKLHYSNS